MYFLAFEAPRGPGPYKTSLVKPAIGFLQRVHPPGFGKKWMEKMDGNCVKKTTTV